jgi:hypothetical protein
MKTPFFLDTIHTQIEKFAEPCQLFKSHHGTAFDVDLCRQQRVKTSWREMLRKEDPNKLLAFSINNVMYDAP